MSKNKGAGIYPLTSAEAVQAHDKMLFEKRKAERFQQSQNIELIHCEIAIATFNRLLNETPHAPRTSLEKAAVYLALKDAGYLALDEPTALMVSQEEARRKAVKEEKLKAGAERQAEEFKQRYTPDKEILTAWDQKQFATIEGMSIFLLEDGCDYIQRNMRGIAKPDSELLQIINYCRNVITAKKQTETSTASNRKKTRSPLDKLKNVFQ